MQEQFAVFFVGLLFLGMLVCLELGLRLGRRTEISERAKPGFGVMEGAMCALLGLLVAFRFSGGRHLIVEEANEIGTAYYLWTCCLQTGSRRFANCSRSR